MPVYRFVGGHALPGWGCAAGVMSCCATTNSWARQSVSKAAAYKQDQFSVVYGFPAKAGAAGGSWRVS